MGKAKLNMYGEYFLGKQFTPEVMDKGKFDYALVLSANSALFNNKSSNALSEKVSLKLRRISDGLESKFESDENILDVRNFIDSAKEDAQIKYLKGKIINVLYFSDKIWQVSINKYALPDV